jgi:hypothetical protein
MLLSRVRIVCASTLTAVFALGLNGCGAEEVKYKPRPAPSGARASLPPVPNVPKRPIKKGGAYTVWGASYYLRSRVHNEEVNHKSISVTGWIGHTNLMQAPECAVHKGGQADPEGCKPDVPAYWICDKKGDNKNDCIKVLGWASNYAQIFDTIEKRKEDEEAEHIDTYWGRPLPCPLPNLGAKVTVTGPYSTTFIGSSTGTEADPIMGILTHTKIDYHEPPPTPALLPGMEEDEK